MGTSDHSRVWHARETVDIFNRHNINLVVHVQALHVLPVAFNHINQIVRRAVLAEQDLAVVDFVLMQNLVHRLIRITPELAKCDQNRSELAPIANQHDKRSHLRQTQRAVKGDTTTIFLPEINVRWLSIQSQSDSLQFVF